MPRRKPLPLRKGPGRPPNEPGPPIDFIKDPDDCLVTVKDVGQWLKVSERMVYKLIQKRHDGLPPPMLFGNVKRWRLGTLRTWMRQRDQQAGRPHVARR